MCLWTPKCDLTKWSTVAHTEGCRLDIHDAFRQKVLTVRYWAVVLGDLCIFNTVLGGGKRKNERGLPAERSQT